MEGNIFSDDNRIHNLPSKMQFPFVFNMAQESNFTVGDRREGTGGTYVPDDILMTWRWKCGSTSLEREYFMRRHRWNIFSR